MQMDKKAGEVSEKTRAVAYVRAARVDGATPVQVEGQLLACHEIAERLGCRITCEYMDIGESGLAAHRPELRKLLDELKEIRPRYVIAADFSRLTRRLDQFAVLVEMVHSVGAEIATRETVAAADGAQADAGWKAVRNA